MTVKYSIHAHTHRSSVILLAAKSREADGVVVLETETSTGYYEGKKMKDG